MRARLMFFGAAKYVADTRKGWNGETEIETTYYNASTGVELGRSFSNVNKWDDFEGNEITSTNIT